MCPISTRCASTTFGVTPFGLAATRSPLAALSLTAMARDTSARFCMRCHCRAIRFHGLHGGGQRNPIGSDCG